MGIRERRWEASGKQKRAWIVDYIGADGRRHIKTFRGKPLAEMFWATTLAQKTPREELDIVLHWLRSQDVYAVRLAEELTVLAGKHR